MTAAEIVRSGMGSIPDVLAAGVVDMASGLLLAVETVASHPESVLDLVARATKEMFEGPTVMEIEHQFQLSRRRADEGHYFQEILIASKNLWHYFGRLRSDPNIVVVFVAKGSANAGLMFVRSREVLQTASV